MYIGTSKVTSKGQLTIPNDIRKKRGLTNGISVIIIDTDAGILVRKATDLKDIFRPFEGAAKGVKLTKAGLGKEVAQEKLKTLALFRK